MSKMKDKHIDWMNEQDAALTREAKQHDFAGEVELEEVFYEERDWSALEGGDWMHYAGTVPTPSGGPARL